MVRGVLLAVCVVLGMTPGSAAEASGPHLTVTVAPSGNCAFAWTATWKGAPVGSKGVVSAWFADVSLVDFGTFPVVKPFGSTGTSIYGGNSETTDFEASAQVRLVDRKGRTVANVTSPTVTIPCSI